MFWVSWGSSVGVIPLGSSPWGAHRRSSVSSSSLLLPPPPPPPPEGRKRRRCLSHKGCWGTHGRRRRIRKGKRRCLTAAAAAAGAGVLAASPAGVEWVSMLPLEPLLKQCAPPGLNTDLRCVASRSASRRSRALACVCPQPLGDQGHRGGG